MKLKLFLFALTTVTATAIFAQGFQLGFKGGATLNKLSGKTFKQEFSQGYHLGLLTSVKVSKKIGIQPEILLNAINVDTSNNFSSIYELNKISRAQLKYLTIPVLVNYNANKLMSFQVGPQFGVLMNRNNTFLQNGANAFKKGDLSMLAGVQLNLFSFKVYGRYVVGLNSINDIDDKDQWKSQSIQVGIGLKL
jgi:hypothetical protein